MKFRQITVVTIATYFILFTLLYMALFINATSDDKNKTYIFLNSDNVIIEQNLQQHFLRPIPFTINMAAKNTIKLLHSIAPNILSNIFQTFLTIREILILRKTCTDFQILLLPNDKNMVMFCKDFLSKGMDYVPLIWFDIKYFLNQSYTNAWKKMKMLNIKENQYAVFTRDEKLISWYNDQAQHIYPKIILNKLENKIFNLYPEIILNSLENKICQLQLDYEAPKIWDKFGTTWAKITNEGNVITGGGEGGSNNAPSSQLQNVKILVSSRSAFSALLGNNCVVSWGDESYGGKIPEPIQSKLETKLNFANDFEFADLCPDGTVVLRGYHTKDSIKLNNVKMIFSTDFAFAALFQDGSVIAWGSEISGGKIPSSIQLQLKCIQMIFSNENSFAALLQNGNVLAWGDKHDGGKIPESIQPYLKNVKTIFSSRWAFSALLHDGSIYAWGDHEYGGHIPHSIQIQLHKNVKMIFSNDNAFIALLNNGKFLAWGSALHGGKITKNIQTKLKNVKVIFSSSTAFAALLDNGSVFAWGYSRDGGKIPDEVQSKLMNNVTMIFPHKHGFKALCSNGEMIEWGSDCN